MKFWVSELLFFQCSTVLLSSPFNSSLLLLIQETAHVVWIKRYNNEEEENQSTATCKATAQVAGVYTLPSTYLSIHEQCELIRETIGERIQLPVEINTVWAKHLTTLIYCQITQNRRQPQIHNSTQWPFAQY